ncbi:hypothetical protein EOD23_00190, partial [Mesorhizobium sp. USDA-HM6]
GVYASLRETADTRSRRGPEERTPAFEDKAYRAAPPSPPPPAAVAPLAPSPTPAKDAGRPGFFGSLASSLRNFMLRRSDEPIDAGSDQTANVRKAPVSKRDFEALPAQRHSYSYRPDDPRPAEPFDDTYSSSAASSHPQSPVAEARQSPDDQQSQVDELRASLREFREAVRDLTESRTRRRYF